MTGHSLVSQLAAGWGAASLLRPARGGEAVGGSCAAPASADGLAESGGGLTRFRANRALA